MVNIEENWFGTMKNKELQEKLKQFPDDATVVVEYCNIRSIRYNEENNLIKID